MNQYEGMNGLEVLWLMLTTEPFFCVIISIGILAIGLSWWCDNYLEDANYSNDEHLR